MRGSLEIPPPPADATSEEALAYLERMAGEALALGYGAMHYRTDRVVARLTLRRPKTKAVPVYVSTPAQRLLFDEASS